MLLSRLEHNVSVQMDLVGLTVGRVSYFGKGKNQIKKQHCL